MKSKFFFISIFLLFSAKLLAGEYKCVKSLSKALGQIDTKTSVSFVDPVAFDYSAGASNVTAKIALIYTKDSLTDVIGASWSYKVNFKFTYPNVENLYFVDSLLISSNNVTQVSEAVKSYAASHSMQLYITKVTSTGTVPHDIRLDILYSNDRFTNLSETATTALGFNSTNNIAYWDYLHGAESYDLEWVFIDSLDGASSFTGAEEPFIFKRPVRINTSNQHFDFSNTYPSGKIYFRVRGVGYFPATKVPAFGPWTYGTGGTSLVVTNTQQLERKKNWQYVTYFAEGGKYKKELSYFDGSMRTRQKLVNLSSDSTILASETKYDYEGRGVVNILPVPVKTASLSYKNNLNSFTNGKIDYDNNTQAGSLTLSSASAASQYYSSLNPFSWAINKNYIPDAEGYPYSQVSFTRDNTGKVLRQNTVGEIFKLQNAVVSQDNHYKKHFYASATETELKRLFGSNAGVASHYKKDMSIDENGQISIEYKDQENRVVATVLGGAAPENLLPLSSNTGAESLPVIAVSLSKNNKVDTLNSISRSVSKIPNINPLQPYSFNFSMTGAINQAGNEFGGICKTCIYELRIKIIDPDGNTIKNITEKLSADTVACASGTIASSHNSLAHTSLASGLQNIIFDKVGEYTIVKDLTLSSGSIDALVSYLKSDTAIFPDSSAIVESYIAQVDSNLCNVSCEDACLTSLKSDPNWNSWTESERAAEVKKCVETNCGSIVNTMTQASAKTTCESLKQQMMEQMKPNGYYNTLSGWLEGKVASVTFHNPDNSVRGTSPSLDSLRNADKFQAQWAADLALAHPEYCHYTNCIADTLSDAYDKKMNLIKGWNQAETSGYINPLNMSTANGSPTANTNQDPFFNSGGRGNSQKANLAALLTSYKNESTDNLDYDDTLGIGGTVSLWTFSESKLLYNNIPPDTAKRWNTFKNLYLGEKQKKKVAVTVSACPYRGNAESTIVQQPTMGPEYNDTLYVNSINYQNTIASARTQCEENVKLWMDKLKVKCSGTNNWLSNGDSLMIADSLGKYCQATAGYANPYGLIIKQTYSANTFLAPVETKLQTSTYGCSLDSIAVEDPCVRYKNKNITLSIVNEGAFLFYELINELIDSIQRTCSTPGSNCLSSNYHSFEAQRMFYVSNFKTYQKNKAFFDSSGPNSTEMVFITIIEQTELINGTSYFTGIRFDFGMDGLSGTSVSHLNKALYDQVPHTNLIKRIFNLRPDPANPQYFLFDIELLNGNIISYPQNRSSSMSATHSEEVHDFLDAVSVQFKTIAYCDSIGVSNPLLTYTTTTKAIKDSCMAAQKREAIALGTKYWKDSVVTFYTAYLQKHFNNCFKNPYAEDFYYNSKAPYQYHYTLYYYDQSGNLVQTISPEGVDTLQVASPAFDTKGNFSGSTQPAHRLITRYKYNSLNQLVWKSSPDEGSSNLYYDDKGQLRLSQSARQKSASKYTYHKYDQRGRTLESGEIKLLQYDSSWFYNPAKADSARLVLNDASFPALSSFVAEDITKIYYDSPFSGATLTQDNLRNRVSASITMPDEETTYSKTCYSYDAHGNVKSQAQDLIYLGSKKVDYSYDLISNKVNKISYQSGQIDQFHHAYTYDADNRITSVRTSKDGLIWDEDARYFYYRHGPLARIELGESKVQGLDYYYTLQGWLKGVNSEALLSTRDAGRDGDTLSSNLNKYSGRDALGFTLGYFNGDYASIGNFSATQNPFASKSGSDLLAARYDLFNGNISSMVTSITNVQTGAAMPNAFAYKYDQLNRIREAKAFDNIDVVNNSWQSGSSYAGRYYNNYTFDANGNILTALVKNQSGQIIDDQTYHYKTQNGKIANNRLYTITDNASVHGSYDLLNQDAFDNTNIENNNYRYTQSGELKYDKQDEIAEIKRRADGKIKEIVRTSGSSMPRLKFNYDASGNRISKHVYDPTDSLIESEYYIRETSGKLLSVYKHVESGPGSGLWQKERYIYGSSLLGIDQTEVNLAGTMISDKASRVLGKRNYSLSNHLGNDLVVLSDRKFGYDQTGDSKADYYIVQLITSRDYGVYGEYLSGRVFNPDYYPNSFNGKRDDAELNGWQDYGFRNYLKLTRRLMDRVDPLSSSYPELTPYQFAGNTPIQAIDLDGLEPSFVNDKNAADYGKTVLEIGKNIGNFLEKTGSFLSGGGFRIEGNPGQADISDDKHLRKPTPGAPIVTIKLDDVAAASTATGTTTNSKNPTANLIKVKPGSLTPQQSSTANQQVNSPGTNDRGTNVYEGPVNGTEPDSVWRMVTETKTNENGQSTTTVEKKKIPNDVYVP